MSSALGMNALHSLNTSGVHAKRCSGVPCENEGAGQAVASSRHWDTHHRFKDLACRGVRPSWLFVFIQILAMVNRGRYSTSSRRHRYALAGPRACREMSAFVAFDPAAALHLLEWTCAGSGNTELFASTGLHQRRVAQTTKSSHVCPSVELDTNATFYVGMIRLIRTAGGATTCSRDFRLLGRLRALRHWSRRHPGTSRVTCSRWNSGMIPMYRSISFRRVWSLMSNVEAALLHSSRTISSPRRTTSIWTRPDISVAGSAFSLTRCGRGHE